MPKTVQKASFNSRTSYQKGKSLANAGVSKAPSVKGESASLTGGPKPTGSKAPKTTADVTASYGATLPISDLQTVADFGKAGKIGKALKVGKPVDYAKSKGDSGSGFNYGKRR